MKQSNLLGLNVDVPDGVKHEFVLNSFVKDVREYLEQVKPEKRKELSFELTVFVCSLAELYYDKRNEGKNKKRAVMETLKGLEDENQLSKMIELALKSNQVVKKTLLRKFNILLNKVLKKVLKW